jgi:hypothetical protein
VSIAKTVLVLAEDLIEPVERLSGIHVVEVVVLGTVALDVAFLVDEVVDEGIGEVEVSLILRDSVELDQGLDHAAIDVVPGVLLPGTDLLDVPGRRLGRRGLHELLDVAVENGI